MKTPTDLRATLTMVLARLDAAPSTPEEWRTIADALAQGAAYARREQGREAETARKAALQ